MAKQRKPARSVLYLQIPDEIRKVLAGSIHNQDMWDWWTTSSGILGSMTPQKYFESFGINDLIIAIQNGLIDQDAE